MYILVTLNDLDLLPTRLPMIMCMDNLVVNVDMQGYNIWTQIDSTIEF